MYENKSTTAPKVFEIIDGNTLMAQEYEPLRFAVDKILPHGVFILAGSGKSFVNRKATELIKQDGYRIDFNSDEDFYVKADEVKITQAFYNLLINAVNYSGACKIITIRQSVSEGYVKIEVTDNGEGIAPDNLPYIRDRYYMVEKKHKRPITGTGLGLSIVKNHRNPRWEIWCGIGVGKRQHILV